MDDDLMNYRRLVQESLRHVVRGALMQIRGPGTLPGGHHFYISFKTQALGVIMSRELRTKYPEEMTIVLQHRFEDLSVVEEAFSVTLYFQGVPEHLVVPFAAVTRFYDPAVEFALMFDVEEASARPDMMEGSGKTSQESPPPSLQTTAMDAESKDEGTESTRASTARDEPEGREMGEVVRLDVFRKK